MTQPSAVVLTSGGMDSTVLLHWVLLRNEAPVPLFVDYGQHCAETELALLRASLPDSCRDKLVVMDCRSVFSKSQSRLIRSTNLWKETIDTPDLNLPYRNTFLLVAGSAFAASIGAAKLYSAFINSNAAHEIDATSAFLRNMEVLMASAGAVRLEMPFKDFSKSDVARLGLELGVSIARTYSCQVGAQAHCGVCPNCVERLNALDAVTCE